MPGIDSEVMVHRSNLFPGKAKEMELHPRVEKAIIEETNKLVKIRFIKEMMYADWLANVVLVKKMNGK